MKVHSLVMKGPEDKGPKTVKIFINQPSTLDFDKAEGNDPTQQIDLTKDDVIVSELPIVKTNPALLLLIIILRFIILSLSKKDPITIQYSHFSQSVHVTQ